MSASTSHTPPPGVVAWIKQRLFQNVWSGVVSILLIPILVYLAYRSLLFVFVNARWEAVERNLTLFMQGTYPRDQQWRLVAQIFLLALALGVGTGTASGTARDKAEEAGLEYIPPSLGGTLSRFWSLILFGVVLLAMAGTGPPVLMTAGAVALGYLGWQSHRLPRRSRVIGWVVTSVLLLAAFQVVSGTIGHAWVPVALVVGAGAWISIKAERIVPPWWRLVIRAAGTAAAVVAVYLVYVAIPYTGIGWDRWSGMHLTLWWSAIVIALSFPFGLLLALARRSSLPALRWVATTYIELIRGVPLITLLFMGQFVLGFFLPAGTSLSRISRSIAAGTMFTAAYVAEIVRGGLQSLPEGQREAGQALGMGPMPIMRRIVLPQALRAVIPALVGQFISLFKDSSLLFILNLIEFLGVRGLVHAQADFRVVGHAETLVFVALGYWAFSFAMSRESQRLERRLRVGVAR
ncbi:MAG: amino acid ABC transporter permease [Actinomycetota bacterium]